MGTRSSRHNRGRKPVYKDARDQTAGSKAIWDQPEFQKTEPTAGEILARPAFQEFHSGEFYRLNQWRNWSATDVEKLRILAEAGSPPEASGDALGRQEKSIAYKARDLGIALPSSWAAFLPKPKYIARPRQPKILLCYPFMVKVNRDEHADMIAVNSLVPKGIPDHMRGDICQDILLAVYEGRVNLVALQKSQKLVKEYISRWRNKNLENGGYGIMSLDPFGDDERSLEERIAAQADWNHSQLNDMRSNHEALSRFYTAPTQESDVYYKEVIGEHLRRCDRGEAITFEETDDLMAENGREYKHSNLVADRIRLAKVMRSSGFLVNDLDLNAAYKGKSVQHAREPDYFDDPAHLSQYIMFKIPGRAAGQCQRRL